MKQLEELHKLVRPAMEEIFGVLWPEEETPSNSFYFAHRLQ